MLILSGTLGMVVLCCLRAFHGMDTMEINIAGRIINKPIEIPGMSLDMDQVPSVSDKKREILEYMGTAPQFHRQRLTLEQSGDPTHMQRCSGDWDRSEKNSMKEDFRAIKDDLTRNLLAGKLENGTPATLTNYKSLHRAIEKFQAHVEEFQSILVSILRAIQLRLHRIELNKKTKMDGLPSPFTSDKKHKSRLQDPQILPISQEAMARTTLSETCKLGTDEIEVIEGHVPRVLARSLVQLLHEISPFDLSDEIDALHEETFIALRLQNLIFKTLDYLHKYRLIPTQDITDYFASKKTLNLAAINIVLLFKINGGFVPEVTMDFDRAYILQSHGSLHFRNLFEALDTDQKRAISYACSKLVSYHHIKHSLAPMLDPESSELLNGTIDFFFKGDRLYKILEHDLQARLSSRSEVIEMRTEEPCEVEFKEKLQDLKFRFLHPDHDQSQWIKLTVQQLILSFIEQNYKNYFIELQDDEDNLEHKLVWVRSNYKYFQELMNIDSYLVQTARRFDPGCNVGFKKKQPSGITKTKALKELELLSSYLLIVSYKHNQWIEGFINRYKIKDDEMLEEINAEIHSVQSTIYRVYTKINKYFMYL
ncbi:hypothetical protein PSTG_00348 [Puccinia striiformis f. sp. tritici PST-78]|uniref:Uncharacterized protein n=1 Tax=Puccinia striiformis f. sp. tritici PST-78 TaxID=1165861 RepID=A0A0L0W4R4_9BASI|nr:hypothetical protein PSTG_00348 [Puccinia striiformis f. sp. tritici PST-78]